MTDHTIIVIFSEHSNSGLKFGFPPYTIIYFSCNIKYERICPLASRILQKRIPIFKYIIFFKSVFVVFLEIVFKGTLLKYASKNMSKTSGRILLYFQKI